MAATRDLARLYECTNGTSRLSSHGGVRKLPYTFTEQCVVMFSTILRTGTISF